MIRDKITGQQFFIDISIDVFIILYNKGHDENTELKLFAAIIQSSILTVSQHQLTT